MSEKAQKSFDVSLGNFTIRCAFCFRGQKDVPTLIMGSFVGICSECVGECNQILAAKMKEQEPVP